MKTALSIGGVVVVALWAGDTRLPRPFATPPAQNRPEEIAQPADATLQVPTGFKVEVWAEHFEKPRFLLQGRQGEILMSDSGSDAESAAVGRESEGGRTGIVYVFAGGKAAQSRKLITGLNRPYGLALWQNYLYVAESDSVKRYPYDASKLTVGKGEEVVSLKGFNKGHWTRSLLFDRAGGKLYVGVGSGSNIDTGEDPRRAAILRVNPDGSGQELFATGTRNPIGLHWYPGSDVLWAAVQERDNLGDDLVPDYLTAVKAKGFYGWPYAYFGPNPEPRIPKQRQDLVSKTITPDLSLGAHRAVLDFTFYAGQQFPAEYRGGAFVAFHGSWNRSKRVGYEVAFVKFEKGRPTGEIHDFLTGWMLGPDDKRVWGRPVAVFEMSDGTLLVTDDGGRKIWRIRYEG